jgi:hypothetical protein
LAFGGSRPLRLAANCWRFEAFGGSRSLRLRLRARVHGIWL